MPKYSQRSLSRLSTCHPELQTLFFEVIRHFDCTILEGHRNEEDQNAAYAKGASQLKWPHGKHNSKPSMAVDVAPYPMPNWKDADDFVYFGGFVMGVASMLKAQGKMTYGIRYGADWDRDKRTSDERFRDSVHFELSAS